MSFLVELKRRNVFRVTIAYLVAAWLLMQIADVVLGNIAAPNWVFQALMLFLAIGLPIAVIFAWAFEMTPEGLKRERDVDRSESITRQTGRRLDRVIIGVLACAVIYFAADKWLGNRPPDADEVPAVAVERSIAVLPFAIRSSDESDILFAEGMHDDILTQLAKLSGLTKVISRTSSARYRDTDKTIPTIGRELGVRTILEGGIQRAGAQVRVNLQLIDTVTDEHIWAENFDFALTIENVLSTQQDIAREVAVALNSTISEGERKRVAAPATNSLKAYQHYINGRQAMSERTSDSLTIALAEYQAAVDLDPNYALAHVGLATSLALQWEHAGVYPPDTFDSFKVAIDRALSIDPTLGEAYATFGLGEMSAAKGNTGGLPYDLPGSYEKAEELFKRAIELSPNYASAYLWLGLLLEETGRREEAILQLRKAKELDPASPLITSWLAALLLEFGRFEEAEVTIREGLRIDPDYWALYPTMGIVLMISGRLGEAAAWVRKGRIAHPSQIEIQSFECELYMELRLTNDASYCIESILARFPDGQVPQQVRIAQAYSYALAQDFESAAKVLDSDDPAFAMSQAVMLVRSGQSSAARELVAVLPGGEKLLSEEPVTIDRSQAYPALLATLSLCDREGCPPRSQYLATQVQSILDGLPAEFLGAQEIWLLIAFNDRSRVLEAGRRMFDSGVRGDWNELRMPIYTKFFAGTDEEADWQALLQNFENDIAAQREWFEANKDEPLF